MCKIRHLRQPADPSDKCEDVKMRKCGNVRNVRTCLPARSEAQEGNLSLS